MIQTNTFDGAVEQSWREFRIELANQLAAMDRDDYFIVGAASADLTSLSVTVDYQVSDGHLVCVARCAGLAVDQVLLSRVHGQGWLPTGESDSVRTDMPVRFADRAAVLSAEFLRQVGGIQHPCFVYARDSEGPVALRSRSADVPLEAAVPTPPQVEFPTDYDELHTAISLALEWKYGTPPVTDEGGDFVLTLGTMQAFVLPDPERPQLRILVPLLTGVTGLTRAAEVLADLNSEYRFVRLTWDGDQVDAAIDLPTSPFSAQQLSDQLDCMAAFLDTIDEEFAQRFDGELARTDDEVDEPEPDLPAGLLALLHLDPGGGGALDAEQVATVCGFDRDTILEYLHISEEQEIAWYNSSNEARDAGDLEEADACAHESHGWERTVTSLREALRVVTLGVRRRPQQMKLFDTQPDQPDLFS